MQGFGKMGEHGVHSIIAPPHEMSPEDAFLSGRFAAGVLLTVVAALNEMQRKPDLAETLLEEHTGEFSQVAQILQSSGMHAYPSFIRREPDNQMLYVVPFIIRTMLQGEPASDRVKEAFEFCHAEYENFEQVRKEAGDIQRAQKFLMTLYQAGARHRGRFKVYRQY